MINTFKTRNATATLGGGLLRAASAVVSLGLCASALTFVAPVHAQTTVTVTDNTDASGAATTGSLRQVLEFAAANCYFGGPFTVNFAIGTGVQTIAPTSPLPIVTCQTLIDGYTQPGATPNSIPNNAAGSNAAIKIVLDGTAALAANSGIELSAAFSAVRGLSVVGFTAVPGIIASGANVSVGGNFVGLLPDGTPKPNVAGIAVTGSIATVGGASAAARNIVSCNTGPGVHVSPPGSADIQNNDIGTKPDGVTPCGNGNGILFSSSTTGSVGGSGLGNFVRNNSSHGVYVDSSNNVPIIQNTINGNGGNGIYLGNGSDCGSIGARLSGNSIGANGLLGIDLAPFGRDINDPLDADGSGCGPANLGQNYPTFDLVTYRPNATEVKFTVASEAGKTYGVEVYSNFVADTTDAGRGEKLRSSTSVTTDTGGNSPSTTLAVSTLPDALYLSMLATEQSLGNTSEFSKPYIAPLTFTPVTGIAAHAITAGTPQTRALTFNILTAQLVSGITVAITPAGNFTIGSESCTASAVAPISSCTVSVTYSRATPTTGPDAALLTVTVPLAANSFTGATTNYEFPLSGTAVATPTPAVSLTPPSVNFGSRTVSTTSAPTTVTLGNSGSALLSIASITATGDFGFTTTCPLSPSTLAVGLGCPINITFTPLTAVAKTGTITIVSNAPGSPHTIALTGTGTAGAVPGISLAPTALTFGPLTVGTIGATQNVVVTNTGLANLAISTITIAAPFARVALGAVTPPDCAATVAPAGKCQIGVIFSPTAVGTFTGQVSIADNVVGTPHLVPLTGTSTPVPVPVIRTSASVAFGDQVINSTGAEQTLVITNVGTATLSVSALTLTGTNAANFKVTGQSGCTSIVPAASCTLTVTFAPITLGAKSAQINITSDAQNAALVNTVSLTGNGILAPRPLVSFSATAVGYGNVIFGGATPNQVITLTNSGGQAMNIVGMLITGDFVQVNNCGTSLASLASCTISIFFTPLAQGNRIGEFVLTTSAATSPDRIQLAGTGCRWFSQSQSRFFLTNCGL